MVFGSIRWLFRRLRELRVQQIVLLGQALGWMLLARVALRIIPVRYVIAWKQRPVSRRQLASGQTAAEQVRQISWAIAVAARRSPVKLVCFPQSLAAHALLAARGIETRLHYGVTRRAEGLETHAWLEAEGQTVTGADEAAAFSLLETY